MRVVFMCTDLEERSQRLEVENGIVQEATTVHWCYNCPILGRGLVFRISVSS